MDRKIFDITYLLLMGTDEKIRLHFGARAAKIPGGLDIASGRLHTASGRDNLYKCIKCKYTE